MRHLQALHVVGADGLAQGDDRLLLRGLDGPELRQLRGEQVREHLRGAQAPYI